MIEFGAHTYAPARGLTAGDLYRWRVEIAAPFLITPVGDDLFRDRLLDCIEWIADASGATPDVVAMDAAEDDRPITILGDALFIASQYPRMGVLWSGLEIEAKISGFKVPRSSRSCVCKACAGDSDTDPACMYTAAGVLPVDRAILQIDPDLITRFWDRPVFLYDLALMRKAQRAIQDLKRMAPADDVATDGDDVARTLATAQRLKAKARR